MSRLSTVYSDPSRETVNELLNTIETTAHSIFESADCAIGREAARMVIKGVTGFRNDYISATESRTRPVLQPDGCDFISGNGFLKNR